MNNAYICDFGKRKAEREKMFDEVRKILSSGDEEDKKKLQELEKIWSGDN